MPETSTDEEDVIRQKVTEISKLQAELDALARITIMLHQR